MNAHFILRVATDRDWAADVRAQSFWLDETNRSVCQSVSLSVEKVCVIFDKLFRIGKCNHYMYRGEAVFFARFDGKFSV